MTTTSTELEHHYRDEPELSIIVPCLDEEDNVSITLDRIAEVLFPNNITDFEILVLDDASTDETFQRSVDYARAHPELHIKTYRRPKPRRGYGAIVRFGVAHARGKYCIPVSGDGVDPLVMIPEMLQKMRAGADMVQCSRYHRKQDSDTIPFGYKFYQFWWRLLIRMMTGKRLPDSTYAFKIYKRIDTMSRGITSNGFSISPEIFFKTLLAEAKIDYVYSRQYDRRHGKSKFFFRREFYGFSYVLMRVFLHRVGILWF